MILAHKKRCFSILTPVKNTTLYGPKFKFTDIVRLQPFVRMAIECNQDLFEEDANIIQENQENQRMLRTLAQYAVQMSLIRECLTLNHANQIPPLVWTRDLEGNNTTNQQRFHRLVQHVTTWFSSRCERVTPVKTNHERTFFVDFIVPIFQYFHDQIQYLQFQW